MEAKYDKWAEPRVQQAKLEDKLSTHGAKLSSSSSSKKKSSNPNTHYIMNKDGNLLAKLFAFVHRIIIASESEGSGGLLEFFNNNCYIFDDDDNADNNADFSIEQYELYQQYEKRIDEGLIKFCESDGGGISKDELMDRVSSAAETNPQCEKLLQMIIATTDFNKFVKFMKTKLKKITEKELEEKESQSQSQQGNPVELNNNLEAK